MIPAHDNPLAAMAFNSQGVRLATASEKVGGARTQETHQYLFCMFGQAFDRQNGF